MNNKFDDVKRFLKKEGFYVILFVCLCAVATVAAITATRRNNNTADNGSTALNQTSQEEKVDQQETANQPEKPDNALQVNKEELEDVPVVQNNNIQSVSSNTSASFVNPVEGTLGRAYSEDPVFWNTTKSYKTHLAMDIKAKEGASVVAVNSGVVKNIGINTEGKYVEIDHQNGLTSIYGNLQDEVAVKVGDSVAQGQEIGKVGNTTNLAYEDYGTYLHFQVLDSGKAVDPARYVNYEN